MSLSIRPIVIVAVVLCWLQVPSARSQTLLKCDKAAFLPGDPASFEGAGGQADDFPDCEFLNCELPILELGPVVNVEPGCDPKVSACDLQVEIRVKFPGNTLNSTNSHSRLFWFTENHPPPNTTGPCLPGGFPTGNNCQPAATCGVNTKELIEERGNYYFDIAPVSCAELIDGIPPVNPLLMTYQVAAISCNRPFSSCVKRINIPVNLTEEQLAIELNCREKEPPRCKDSCLCDVAGGAGAPPNGNGSGQSSTPGGSPGGVILRYRAGGVGHPGYAGSALHNQTLGRYWTHDGAVRIVEETPGDPSVVWLLDERGTFTKLTNSTSGSLPDPYEGADPADVYETLFETSTGWELHGLDGTVRSFDSQGRWFRTQDRNGNLMEGTFDAEGRLAELTKPDGRRETFDYYGVGDPSEGKLETITLWGVNDVGQRIWTYLWTGEDLTRIDRPDGRSLLFDYDDPLNPQHPAGYMTRMKLLGDQGGERILQAWEYDADGNVSSTWKGAEDKTDPEAVERYDLSYDASFQPSQTVVTDPLGRQTTFELEYEGRQFRVKSLDAPCPTCGYGPQTDFEYDDPANPLLPTATVDGRGIRTEHTYNADGRLTSRTEAFGLSTERTTSWSYGLAGFPAFATAVFQPSTQTGQMRTTTNAYDPSTGDLLSRTLDGYEAGSPLTGQTTTSTYETSGQVSTVDPPGHGTADLTQFHYDDPALNDLLPTRRTDPLIGDTHFVYDPFNRRIATVDPNGLRTETEYDGLDRVTATRQCEVALPGDDCENALGPVLATTHSYSEFGDLEITELPAGNAIEYGYDAAGRLLSIERKADTQPSTRGERTSYELDDAGNRTLEEQQSWTGTAWITVSQTAFTYSNRCQVETVTTGLPGEQSTTEHAYDCNGNLEKVWDPNHPSAGQTATPSSSYAYDALNRLTSVTQPWGGTGPATVSTVYEYDVQDHLTKVTDAELGETTYTYSDRDLLTEEISEVSGTTTYTYGDSGELEVSTDARGVTTTRVLDALDRVTQVSYSGAPGLTTTYTYDDPMVAYSLGRLTQVSRGGFDVGYAFDAFGRLTQDGDLAYSYDTNGNRETMTYPGGTTATYGYDFADRQSTLEVQVGAGAPQGLVSAASYLPSGPLTGLTLGNGVTETRLFDSRYFPESISANGALTRLWDYQTDDVGNVTSIDETVDCPAANITLSGETVTTTEVIESCGDLTAGNGYQVAAPGDVTFRAEGQVVLQDGFSVGAGGRFTAGGGVDLGLPVMTSRTYAYQDYQYYLTGGDGPWGMLSWTYDGIGNRLSETRNGIVDTYDYLLNNAGGHSATLDEIQLGMMGLKTYDFGLAGHLEEVDASGNVITFSSDAEGRLSQLSRTSASASFLYDGRSFLSSSVETGTGNFTEPTYSSEGLLCSLFGSADGGATTSRRHVLYFAGRPVAILEVPSLGTESYTFLSTDHLGTPFVATDLGGGEIWAGGFEPFGADWQAGTPAGAQANGVFLRFPGQWFDESWEMAGLGVGSYYNLHRWLEISTGRYTRPDPVGLEGGINKFTYVLARPINFADPSGLQVAQVCCRPLNPAQQWRFLNRISRPFAAPQGQHCFVRHADDDGRTIRTWSLENTGGLALPGEDFPSDFDYEPQAGECGAPVRCTERVERCLTSITLDYHTRDYPNRGGVGITTGSISSTSEPNSNSFAQHLSRTCSVNEPEFVSERNTPGWFYWLTSGRTP